MSSSAYLQFLPVFNFAYQITDRGSRADENISFWTPAVPPGWWWLGMFPTNTYGPPAGPAFVTQAVNDVPSSPLLKAPTGLTQIWTCTGDNQVNNLGIYSLRAPPGYIGIGIIAVSNFGVPPQVADFPTLMCVRQDQCRKAHVSGRVWDDRGSAAPSDINVFMLPNARVAFAVVQDGYQKSAEFWDLVIPPTSSDVTD
ncbi:MAG: hypothetical protein AMXMBFR59_40720 [Rhodanobacteraceae bacterium]